MNDFTSGNFASVINSYGGFDNYTQKLGGVFDEYYGEQPVVKTAYEFQKVAEYVFGFMTMYGFDYYNGSKYCKWGGGDCAKIEEIHEHMADETKGRFPKPGSSDAFYPGTEMYIDHGLSSPKNHFDKLISGSNGVNMTTNCNWTVDMVYYKAGIFGQGRTPITASTQYTKMFNSDTCKVIKDPHDIRVGDIVEYFEGNVNPDDVSTWNGWYHVAFVGEVNKAKNTWTTYDGGSLLMMQQSHKVVHSMDKPITSEVVIRVIDLQ